jgi:hypothetical protein
MRRVSYSVIGLIILSRWARVGGELVAAVRQGFSHLCPVDVPGYGKRTLFLLLFLNGLVVARVQEPFLLRVLKG